MIPFTLKLGHFSKMIVYTDLLRQLTTTITISKQQQKTQQAFKQMFLSLKQSVGIFIILVITTWSLKFNTISLL